MPAFQKWFQSSNLKCFKIEPPSGKTRIFWLKWKIWTSFERSKAILSHWQLFNQSVGLRAKKQKNLFICDLVFPTCGRCKLQRKTFFLSMIWWGRGGGLVDREAESGTGTCYPSSIPLGEKKYEVRLLRWRSLAVSRHVVTSKSNLLLTSYFNLQESETN